MFTFLNALLQIAVEAQTLPDSRGYGRSVGKPNFRLKLFLLQGFYVELSTNENHSRKLSQTHTKTFDFPLRSGKLNRRGPR